MPSVEPTWRHHPFVRRAKPARLTTRAPESPKPWDAEMLPAFVDKSGWVFHYDHEDIMRLRRIVALRQGVTPMPVYYHLVRISEEEQTVAGHPMLREEMVRVLNANKFVPAEVEIRFREAVE